MFLWMIAVALSITGVLHYTAEQWMFLTDNKKFYFYCINCGQKFDWSDNDE